MKNNLYIKMNFQRKVLGILCALLPITCILFGLFGDNLPLWYCSISATYYANSKVCMIGLLFATSVFFFSYRGYDWRDITLNTIQAVAALGVICFPCQTPGAPANVGIFSLPIAVSHIIHCISAGLLFTAFDINVFFLFTLGDTTNPKKAQRNQVYTTCGLIIFIAIVLQIASCVAFHFPEWLPVTLINETVMLEAYAVAWLTKCGFFKKLND